MRQRSGLTPDVVDGVGQTPSVEVKASWRARRYIDWRGGQLFVWFSPLGPDLFQHVSTKQPDAIRFNRYWADGFTVHLQADFDPPERLEVTKLVWPLGLDVTGTGAGEYSGGSGGDGGSWPGHGDGGGGGGGHGGGGHH